MQNELNTLGEDFCKAGSSNSLTVPETVPESDEVLGLLGVALPCLFSVMH